MHSIRDDVIAFIYSSSSIVEFISNKAERYSILSSGFLGCGVTCARRCEFTIDPNSAWSYR